MKRLLQSVSLLALVLAVLDPALAASKESGQHPRIVMVVAPKDFTDQEYADPRAVFEKMGADVRVACTSKEAAISHNGTRLRVDQATGEIRLDQFDAIVIVGGTGALTYLMDDEALRNIIVAASRSGKIVAAICVAPAVLAHAGVLETGKRRVILTSALSQS